MAWVDVRSPQGRGSAGPWASPRAPPQQAACPSFRSLVATPQHWRELGVNALLSSVPYSALSLVPPAGQTHQVARGCTSGLAFQVCVGRA